MTKEDLQKDSVNVLKPITVVLNGLSSADNAWVNALVDEYLEKQVHNVFLLELEDHEELMKNDTLISNEITEFFNEIYNRTGEEYLHWHLIGISSSGFYTAVDVGRKMFSKSTIFVQRLEKTHKNSKKLHLFLFYRFNKSETASNHQTHHWDFRPNHS